MPRWHRFVIPMQNKETTMRKQGRPDVILPIGTKVLIDAPIGSSWNGQVGTVIAYRVNEGYFYYWVGMPILHPQLNQPILLDGKPQLLEQMFRPDEIKEVPD